MVKRHLGAHKSTSSTYEFKAGDIVWAPYRGTPEWPAVVRCVYPKKVTFAFLPILDNSMSKTCIFSRPPNKLRPFLGTETLPANAKSDLREAFKAAVELSKGFRPDNLDIPVDTGNLRTSGADKHRALSDLDVKYAMKKEMDATSNMDTASNASTPQWSVGDVAWLRALDHTEWPVVIREIKKKYVMVDSFPLKLNRKSERYPLSACQKFDHTIKSLDAAIKREHNYELRLALLSVQKYFNAQKNEGSTRGDKSDTECDEHMQGENEILKKIKKSVAYVGIEEERESVGDAAESESIKREAGTTVFSDGESRAKRAMDSSPAMAKRPKFSDAVKNLEAELGEKIENLEKGDLAWINRARSGRIVKWPILVLKVDNAKKSCVCTELPLDDLTASVEWCLNSEKTLVVPLKNIYLYDTVEIKMDEIEDEELKAAVAQAEDIVDGRCRPFEKDMKMDADGRTRENGCKGGSLSPKDIMRLCKSDMCSRHLMAIWTGQFSCYRHANYDPPIVPPLHFELQIGDLLPEVNAIALVEHLDATVVKFKDSMKSSLRRLHYVTNVVLPEAIIFAITQIRYCSGREANEIFTNAISLNNEKSPSVSVVNEVDITPTTGFEQLLKAASKVRCATLGVE